MILRSLGCHWRGGLSELPRPLFGTERLQMMSPPSKNFFVIFRFMPISIGREIFLTDKKCLHVHGGTFILQFDRLIVIR